MNLSLTVWADVCYRANSSCIRLEATPLINLGKINLKGFALRKKLLPLNPL